MNFTTVDEYRDHLETIAEPQDIDASCLNAVFRGWVAGDDFDGTNVGPTFGTIVEVSHRVGAGLFGPVTYTSVKLCPDCVHKASDGCPSPESLEALHVIALDRIVRNGDGCTCENGEYCDLDSSPLAKVEA